MALLSIGEDPCAWVEVPGYPGFDMYIKYLTPEVIRGLRRRATTAKRNKQTRAMEDSVNDELLSKLMVKEIIMEWRGLSLKHLDKLVELSPEARASIEKQKDKCLPFDEDDLETLVDNTYSREFMENILDLATDLQAFREIQKTVTAKNSGGSSPTPEQEVGL